MQSLESLSTTWHPLLKRQIDKYLAEKNSLADYQNFLQIVNSAYFEFEEDRRLNERSLELSFAELEQIVERLHQEMAEKEKNEEKYRNIFETTSVALLEINLAKLFDKIEEWRKQNSLNLPLPQELITQAVNLYCDGIIGANETALALFGFNENEDLKEQCRQMASFNQTGWMQSFIENIIQGHMSFEMELDIQTEDKKALHLLLQARFSRKTPYSAIICIVNTTKQTELERQLRQSQKMEAIGRLAGGVAHDFNNLLTVILNCAEMIEQEAIDNNVQKKVKTILECSEKAAALTSQLLAFSRKQALNLQIIDINEALDRIQAILKRILGEDIELETIFEKNLPKVKIDTSQIEQVILNLAVNARDAMPKGGTLNIATKKIVLDANTLQGRDVKAGTYVAISVSDTGTGIPKDIIEHIFEPFFTTKEVGKGTGLGLSTVYGNISQNKGYITVYSEEGNGTTFKVYLPASLESTVQVSEDKPSESEKMDTDKTILLVEDEDSVRKIAATILKNKGYNILVANGPQEGLEICDKYPEKINMLLTDVVMPKMSGKQLATKVKHERPNINILYMSGYPMDIIAKNGVLEASSNFLEKPFTARSLLDKVNATLKEKL